MIQWKLEHIQTLIKEKARENLCKSGTRAREIRAKLREKSLTHTIITEQWWLQPTKETKAKVNEWFWLESDDPYQTNEKDKDSEKMEEDRKIEREKMTRICVYM